MGGGMARVRGKSGSRSASVLVAIALAVALMAADSAAAATINIARSKDFITYNRDSVKISGRLQTDAGGPAVGNREVKLYEKPYPYKRSKVIARTQTDAEGKYRFGGVQPDFNTRYRAAVGDPGVEARSKLKLVYVFARGGLSTRATRDGHAKSRFRLVFAPKLPTRLGGRKVVWYFHRLGTSRFTARDRSRSKEPRRGLLKGRSRFKLPDGRYRFQVTYCLDGPDKRDIGLGPPGVSRDCPRSFPANGRTLSSGSSAEADAVGASLSGSAEIVSASSR